jgi:predicted permease
MDSWKLHLRFAMRQLARNPGFTITVVVTLALSIGANTAIFSLVNALLLKSLPYANPARLGAIYARVSGPNPSDDLRGLDGDQWELLRDQVPAVISAVSGTAAGANLQAGIRARYVRNGRISAHYFDVLGLQPLLGRDFSEEEDHVHGPKAAILSYGLWRNFFGGKTNILGQAILLKGEPHTVVGILPQGAVTPSNADVYTVLQASREGEGGGTNFQAITRLRDGHTWQEADAEINRAWALSTQNFEKRSPGAQLTYYSVPLQKSQTDELRPQVLALMLAAGLILLIACANLAGLALVRMFSRTSEVATRLALGASRWQIQKQFWAENLLLAVFGGMAGIGIGFLGLRGLLLLLPEGFLPVTHVSVDGRVMVFTLILSVLTSVLFGMLPALATRRVDIRSSMGGRGMAKIGSLRVRQVLIAGEVALTVMLLSACGLLIRSLIHLETLAPGFNPNGVMVAKASLDDVRYHDPVAFRKLLQESTAAMRRIPGVQSAAMGLSLPYERALNDQITFSDGKEAGLQEVTDITYVTPEYFTALQMPLRAGRFFTEADAPGAQKVAIVNQAFARKFYGGASPVGRHVNKDILIVGEVSDVAVSSGIYGGVGPLTSEQAMYVPAAQMDEHGLPLIHMWFQPDWIVRTVGPVNGLIGQIERALASVDPNLPTSGFYSMRDLLAQTLATQRVEVALLSAMAVLALLLSGLGISALVANLVSQRTREIGIRMALGSTVGQAMMHIGLFGAGASVAGVIVGLCLSFATLRLMRSLIYGVGVYDAGTLGAVVAMLVLVTLLAAAGPTLRIAKIDPAKTLREE